MIVSSLPEINESHNKESYISKANMLAAMRVGFYSVGVGMAPMNPYMMYMTGMSPVVQQPFNSYAINMMGMRPAMNMPMSGINNGMMQVRPNSKNPFDY